MNAVAAPSPRAITWQRRRRALAAAWRDFRGHPPGMVGLVVLGLIIVMALAAPLIADEAGLRAVNTTENPTWASPSEFGPLGTDNFGRSVWTQFVWGARISLVVGLAATVLTMLIGSVVGIVAGFRGGIVRSILMRLTEWFLVIPFLPLAIVLATILGPSIENIILVIGITSWPSTARIICAQVLTLRERDYVDRSRALGASDWHLMTRHVLPNVSPLILANTTLTVPVVILSEALLSFLGFGDPANISWGTMLDQAFEAGAISRSAWWYFIPPGLGVLFVALSFTLIGTALEEVLDPRLKERG
jgi:peptide/nickel transport system permease protein